MECNPSEPAGSKTRRRYTPIYETEGNQSFPAFTKPNKACSGFWWAVRHLRVLSTLCFIWLSGFILPTTKTTNASPLARIFQKE